MGLLKTYSVIIVTLHEFVTVRFYLSCKLVLKGRISVSVIVLFLTSFSI